MNTREQDLIEKRSELETALDVSNSDEVFAIASRAALSLEFRSTDAMIGLDTVPDALVELVEDLVIKSFGRAAELGHGEARVRLADFLVHRDREEQAVSVLLEAVKRGDRVAGGVAAELLWRRHDEASAQDAFRMAQNAAEGDTTGRPDYLLGLFRFNGFGCERDLAKSVEHHRLAAEAGDADAMFEYSVMLGQGLGTNVDPDGSIKWCERAAEADQPRAQYNMGAFCATGRGVDQDMAVAVRWYSRAAHNGHGRAAATLGIMYALGSGTDPDDAQATTFFALAGDAGYDWQTMAAGVGLDPSAFE